LRGEYGQEISGVYGNIATSVRDSCHANGAKIILGIHSVTDAANLAYVAADAGRISTFCAAVAGYAQRHGYDGIGINWEWPGNVGSTNAQVRALIVGLRAALRNVGMTPLIFMTNYVALGATPSGWETDATIQDSLDYIMPEMYTLGFWQTGNYLGYTAAVDRPSISPRTYDALVWNDSAGTAVNGHQAGPKGLVGLGWSRSKILPGIGLEAVTYSRAGTTPIQVGDPIGNLSDLSWGVGLYNFLLERDYGSGNLVSIPRQWDATAQQPYKQWTSGGTSYFRSYEDSQSVYIKGQWIKDNGFGGAMRETDGLFSGR